MARIVVVDDEPTVCRLLVDILTAEGHSVFALVDGGQAIGMIADGLDFDVLITDLQMPGLSGSQLIAILRKLGCSRRLVAMTGRVGVTAVEGADAVISKPFRWPEFNKALGI